MCPCVVCRGAVPGRLFCGFGGDAKFNWLLDTLANMTRSFIAPDLLLLPKQRISNARRFQARRIWLTPVNQLCVSLPHDKQSHAPDFRSSMSLTGVTVFAWFLLFRDAGVLSAMRALARLLLLLASCSYCGALSMVGTSVSRSQSRLLKFPANEVGDT